MCVLLVAVFLFVYLENTVDDQYLWNWTSWLFVFVIFAVLLIIATPVVALGIFLFLRFHNVIRVRVLGIPRNDNVGMTPLLVLLSAILIVLFFAASLIFFNSVPFRM